MMHNRMFAANFSANTHLQSASDFQSSFVFENRVALQVVNFLILNENGRGVCLHSFFFSSLALVSIGWREQDS